MNIFLILCAFLFVMFVHADEIKKCEFQKAERIVKDFGLRPIEVEYTSTFDGCDNPLDSTVLNKNIFCISFELKNKKNFRGTNFEKGASFKVCEWVGVVDMTQPRPELSINMEDGVVCKQSAMFLSNKLCSYFIAKPYKIDSFKIPENTLVFHINDIFFFRVQKDMVINKTKLSSDKLYYVEKGKIKSDIESKLKRNPDEICAIRQ